MQFEHIGLRPIDVVVDGVSASVKNVIQAHAALNNGVCSGMLWISLQNAL